VGRAQRHIPELFERLAELIERCTACEGGIGGIKGRQLRLEIVRCRGRLPEPEAECFTESFGFVRRGIVHCGERLQ
jgi:hypothetical protein